MFLNFVVRILGRSHKHTFRAIIGFALIISMIVATSGVISGLTVHIFGITERAGESQSIFIQSRNPTEGIPYELLPLINHTNIEHILPIAERNVSYNSKMESFNSNIVGLNLSQLMQYYSLAEVFAGRFPQSNVNYTECLMGKDLHEVVGSSEINLTYNSIKTSKPLIVVGLIHNVREFQSTILVELTDYIKIFNQNLTQNIYQRIKIRLKSGRFAEETISALKAILKDYMHFLTIKPEQQADILTESLFSDIISQLNLLFGVLFIIALVRIFHAISWFVRNYERDFLIMRSLGISSSQMIFLVLLLAELIGNAGFVIGILFGILIPSLIFTILTLFFSEAFLIPEFTITSLIPLFFLSNLVVVVAAIYPVIVITRKNPSYLSLSTHGLDR